MQSRTKESYQVKNIPLEVKLYQTTVNDKKTKTLDFQVMVEQQRVLTVVDTATQPLFQLNMKRK